MRNHDVPKVTPATSVLEAERLEAIEKCRQTIEKEIDFVDIKPYSHNIIGLALASLAEKTDNEAANMLIDEFDLESLGWSKVE